MTNDSSKHRNDNVLVCGALTKFIDGRFSLFLTECIALREGLKLAKELEIDGLVVETDATNIAAVKPGDLELSVEGPILDDTQSLLDHLRQSVANHVRHNANQAAHLLASFGFNSKCLHFGFMRLHL
ncbi:hypothetical protein TIFTF001_029364 [Ficus carica]|uniref:RNase H type-1 domain-containing protein n=1 Tax=Ficus carica TaxID=3494 RepID=A0AA88DRM3_FICCA|nr:hypothetical protein TIFTF001_029364 [Ficus carica]